MRRSVPVCIFLALVVFLPGGIQARHIIGSDFYYICQGEGRNGGTKKYSFHLDVYRDCSTNILFNPNAAFGIYKFSGGNGYTFVSQFNIGHGTISNVKPDQNPCIIIPPNVCVETTDYEFTIDLPVINETYVIFYIQCCRNRTILNIPDPGSTGATFFIEISPMSQQTCNSSPRFKTFPPIVVCADFPLNFDHSASDAEGDSLVYEFCPLLAGGGPGGGGFGGGGFPGGGGQGGCGTPTPDPRICPPPFSILQSVSGFSYETPMGPGVLNLNALTGLLTGRPTNLGQYVVGICVKEYRNGTLIGSIHRDFQFNVAICEQSVYAKIKADSASLSDKKFKITYCGDNLLKFKNESYTEEFIKDYYWEFRPKNNPASTERLTSTDKDASIAFTRPGQYSGVMIVNRNALVCNDTAFIELNIIPSDIKADFEFDYDKCSTLPIKFNDRSTGVVTPVKNYEWTFDDGSFSASRNPSHLFQKPGNYAIKLQVTDGKICRSEKIKELNYFPAPQLLDILPDKFRACAPATINFRNLSIPVDETYQVEWDFGDGNKFTGIHASHTYTRAGTYTIGLSLKAPSGCVTRETFPGFVRVQEGPEADFRFSPEDPNLLNPTVQFTNLSRAAVEYAWDFGDESGATEKNPLHTYPDTGNYVVSLSVRHENGCRDSVARLVRVGLYITYFLPNAFTPNNDGVNDLYFGTGTFPGMQDFNLNIFNRWGELIFSTEDPSEGWNGRKQNKGPMEPNGVYICIVKYKNDRGDPREVTGFATLIR